MFAVFAYQSVNSNSSTNHDIKSGAGQHFQRKTETKLSQEYPKIKAGYLAHPTNPSIPADEAIQGLAELIRMASKKRSRETMVIEQPGMLTSEASQIYQASYRAPGRKCDLLVFGELNSKHASWNSLSQAPKWAYHSKQEHATA